MAEITTPTLHIGPLVATTGTFSGAVSMTALTATTGALSSNLTVGGTAAITGAVTLSSTLAVTGDITATARIIQTAVAEPSAVGQYGFSATDGNYIYAKAGSAYDFTLFNDVMGAGAAVLRVPTGTRDINVASGRVLIGTTVTTGAAAGDAVLANAKFLRGVNAAGTTGAQLISIGSDDVVALAGATGTLDAGYFVRGPYIAAATYPAGSATRNGMQGVDGTNNRFVYYSGGNRYYLTGTAF